jgi:lysozyme family protein
MKNNWKIACHVLIELEGGYANIAGDRGGKTKYGWTQKALTDLRYPIPVEHLELPEAKHLYFKYYWQGDLVEKIKDPLLASVMLHLEVVTGPYGNRSDQATKMLQRALLLQGYAVQVDGVTGPATLKAVNEADPVVLAHAVSAAFIQHAAWLEASGKGPFLNGWTNRAINGIKWTNEEISRYE